MDGIRAHGSMESKRPVLGLNRYPAKNQTQRTLKYRVRCCYVLISHYVLVVQISNEETPLSAILLQTSSETHEIHPHSRLISRATLGCPLEILQTDFHLHHPAYTHKPFRLLLVIHHHRPSPTSDPNRIAASREPA